MKMTVHYICPKCDGKNQFVIKQGETEKVFYCSSCGFENTCTIRDEIWDEESETVH